MSNEMDMTKLGFFGRIRKFFWKFALITIYHEENFQPSFPDCDIEIWNFVDSLSNELLPDELLLRKLSNVDLKFGDVTISFDHQRDLRSVAVDTHLVYVSKETRKFIMAKMREMVDANTKRASLGVADSLKNDIQASYLETKGL